MAEYKLNKPHPHHSNGEGYITKNGHTMFNQDIVAELNQIKNLKKEWYKKLLNKLVLIRLGEKSLPDYIDEVNSKISSNNNTEL